MHVRRFGLVSLLASLVLLVPNALAAVFPDVPDGHIFQDAVEQLVSVGVINGNPDGNFYPNRDVNRAEMLKMLYIANGRKPDPTNIRCFPDVTPGSWYESYVCDAAAHGFVRGYASGNFEPARTVNRVEALKMVQEVFEFDIGEITDYDRDIIKFVDVSTSAWYTKYLFNAYAVGILPIPGQESGRFYPERTLTRGEAAAYIFNTIKAKLALDRQEEEEEEPTDSKEEVEAEDDPNILDVDFPFGGGGKFNAKKPFAYRFHLDSRETVFTEASLQAGQPGTITCTLFLLDDEGFSEQYYIGTQEGTDCYLLTTLVPGHYQLQLQPSEADTTYKVNTSIDTLHGDDNDGFSQAHTISTITSSTRVLEANNFVDFYTFVVSEETRQMVQLSNSQELNCIVYAMGDVDLYGFAGPQCNRFYEYPPGTYFVAVSRKAPKASRQTYTVRLVE